MSSGAYSPRGTGVSHGNLRMFTRDMEARMRRHMQRRGSLLAVLSFAVLVVAAPGFAAERDGFGIRPLSAQDWFTYSVLPGETVEGVALAINSRSEPLDVLVYAADAFTTPQGGFALQERAEDPQDLGAWVSLETDRIRLEPGERLRLPFRVTVPASAEPGDYAAGVVLEAAPRHGESEDMGDDTQLQIDIIERVGARIYLTVEGKAERRLDAGALSWTRSGGDIVFLLPASNRGNVRVPVSGTIELSGWLSEDVRLDFGTTELLAGSDTVLTARWENPPTTFFGRATATVHYGDDQALQSTTSVRLIPIALLLGVPAGLLAIGFVGWRFLRFWRRAREALQLIEDTGDGGPRTSTRRPSPSPARTTIVAGDGRSESAPRLRNGQRVRPDPRPAGRRPSGLRGGVGGGAGRSARARRRGDGDDW